MTTQAEIEQINVKDLMLDSPKPNEASFDPAKEITQQDLIHIKAELKKMRSDGNWNKAAEIFIAMRLVLPDGPTNFPTSVVDQRFLSQKYLDFADVHNWPVALSYAAKYKQIFPDNISELGISDLDKEEMRNALRKETNIPNWANYSRVAVNLLILFPDQRDWLELDQAAYSKINQLMINLDQVDADQQSAAGRRMLFTDAELASNLRILYPGQPPNISTKSWDLLKVGWREQRETSSDRRIDDNWWRFAVMASYLKILAAKELTLTANGIKLDQHPESQLELASTIPESRKF